MQSCRRGIIDEYRAVFLFFDQEIYKIFQQFMCGMVQ